MLFILSSCFIISTTLLKEKEIKHNNLKKNIDVIYAGSKYVVNDIVIELMNQRLIGNLFNE